LKPVLSNLNLDSLIFGPLDMHRYRLNELHLQLDYPVGINVVLDPVPKVNERVVDVLVQVDHALKPCDGKSIRAGLARRGWIDSRMKCNWTVLLDAELPRDGKSCET
jgi:hypothetical protein